MEFEVDIIFNQDLELVDILNKATRIECFKETKYKFDEFVDKIQHKPQSGIHQIVMGLVRFRFGMFSLPWIRIEPNRTIDIKWKPNQTIYELSAI